jgi:prolyl-tRNA synthetase
MKDAIRASQMFPATHRADPSDAGTPGHKLLVRAGLIRQTAAGIFTLLPLAIRVLTKIEAIVRDEMNTIGGLEVHLPILQPRELWQQTGRWDRYVGDRIMFQLKDRKGQAFGISPTAEEVVTDLVRVDLSSYGQLPLNLYQIEWKGRDELRPRMGLLRCREFRMKDAYTFDVDEAGMRRSYDQHREAYANMFRRMGFDFISVQADSGAIGGKGSAEFMALCPVGEDVLLTCDHCDYGANREKAESHFAPQAYLGISNPLRKEPTPNVRTVDELERFFSLTSRQMVKTIIYVADDQPVAICCRGDLTINEVKLKNFLGATQLDVADDATVVEATGAPVGFAGPIGLKGVSRIIYDTSLEPMTNFLCGCNQVDVHLLDVNFGRDLPRPESFHDVHDAQADDTCSVCNQGTLRESRGIELGHVFQLQQGYAEKLKVTFTGADGEEATPWMGCYGIGTTRCLQALSEQHHDQDGIKWPAQMAPFETVIVPTASAEDSVQRQVAERLFAAMAETGKEVVLDDRDMRFGAKMKDALLVGYPSIYVVGRDAVDNKVEVQDRATGEKRTVELRELLDPS